MRKYFNYNKNSGLTRDDTVKEGSVQVDLLSDLHIEMMMNSDEIATVDSKRQFLKRKVEEIKESSKGSELIVVAGDISHSNTISYLFLKELSLYWEYVLVIPGNHDIQDKRRVVERYEELMNALAEVENIVFLFDKVNLFEYKGFKFAGTFMTYNLNDMKDFKEWKYKLSDSSEITRKLIMERNKKEVEYYLDNINKVDMFISHVPIVNLDGDNATPNLFLNVDVLPVKGVLYVSGHTHKQKNSIDWESPYDALNVSYGYPSEHGDLVTSVHMSK